MLYCPHFKVTFCAFWILLLVVGCDPRSLTLYTAKLLQKCDCINFYSRNLHKQPSLSYMRGAQDQSFPYLDQIIFTIKYGDKCTRES